MCRWFATRHHVLDHKVSTAPSSSRLGMNREMEEKCGAVNERSSKGEKEEKGGQRKRSRGKYSRGE